MWTPWGHRMGLFVRQGLRSLGWVGAGGGGGNRMFPVFLGDQARATILTSPLGGPHPLQICIVFCLAIICINDAESLNDSSHQY